MTVKIMLLEELEKTKEGKRFFEKVKKTDSCWIWLAAKNGGYGWMWDPFKRTQVRSHQWLKALVDGPCPKSRECCHTCNVRECVNPQHIYYGTRRDNMQDLIRDKGHNWAGVSKQGEDSPNSILTTVQVLEILDLHYKTGWKGKRLSRELNINASTINNVIYNKRWKHIKRKEG
jgi:hypothetical protein